MSLRLRLTLLYSTLLALTLLLLGVALYLTVSRVTFATLEEALTDDTRQLVNNGRFRPNNIDMPYWKLGSSATVFQTCDLNGQPLDRSPGLGEEQLPLSASGLAAVRAGKPWTEVANLEGGRLLVHSRALLSRNQIIGVIQAARPLAEYDQLLTTLALALAGGGGLGAVVALGVGWLLAGTALRPIDRITQTAQMIGNERDFTKRVNYQGPNDEVGRLATTFNTMLTELHASYRQVAQALQTQRRFVADASHELRTPLTTIRGNLELLGREPPIAASDRREVLGDTIDETERLVRLVNDLLALARADAGWQPTLTTVPLAPLVEEVGRQARTLAPDREITIDLPGDLTVHANRDLLKQVLLILVDNALRHTPPVTPIHLHARSEDNRLIVHSHGKASEPLAAQVVLEVRDAGGGISAAQLPYLFERFYRGDSSRSAGGTGLGLAIARTLVEAQHGAIDVASLPGEGSMFSVRLPAAEVKG